MDNVKYRLLQYAKSQDFGMMDFYKKTSVSQSNFSGKGGESRLSSDKIIQILIAFPNLNPDWLLLGEGEMIRKKETESSVSEKMYNELRKEKDELIRENERLKISIEQLKKELARMQLDATASAQPAVSA